MTLIPKFQIGLLNGWIYLCVFCLVQAFWMITFPKPVVAKLLKRFSKAGWSKTQIICTIIGKVLTLVNLIIIILSSIKTNSVVFPIGTILFVIGIIGFIIALYNFKNTALDKPVTTGLYKISRNPQQVTMRVIAIGIYIAIGSLIGLIILLVTFIFSHIGILAEEKVCLKKYGDSYREYMKRIPRYIGIPKKAKNG